jgi:hypothetical protein
MDFGTMRDAAAGSIRIGDPGQVYWKNQGKGAEMAKTSNAVIRRHALMLLILIFLMLTGCRSAGPGGDGAALSAGEKFSANPRTADDLLIVDCLLPGQVRMLGTMTYLTPRRPVKVTALECRIRGGEYVAYDRGDIQNALAIWLPKAEAGDETAQTYVGEIYQRGMGGAAPRYDKAAEWFGKASDQGYHRAQIHLGYLYENGLGVPKDLEKALQLYRRATGMTEAIRLEPEPLAAPERRELEELRREVVRQRAEVRSLRRQLEDARRKLKRTRNDVEWRQNEIQAEREGLARARAALARLKAQAAGDEPGVGERLAAMENELQKREEILEAQRRESERLNGEVKRLEAESRTYQEQLASLKDVTADEGDDIRSLREEVERRREEAEALRIQLDRKASELERVQRDFAWKQEQIEAERKGIERARIALEKQALETSAAAGDENRRMAKVLAEREAALAFQEQAAQRLKGEVARLEAEAARYDRQLSAYQKKIASLPEPTIDIIQPKILTTRSRWVAAGGTEGEPLRLVGKVVAPAGLYSLNVNETPTDTGAGGLFETWIPVKPEAETPIRIVAVDDQGRQKDVEFFIQEPAASGDPDKKIEPRRFGRYYALIIGNNDYASLPNLDTAVRDAEALSILLEERYGFSTRVMVNATRFDIYKALDDYRVKLTEKENFLLYYAGHGELDKQNSRGYWLPVDADPDSFVNSIPNYTVTDILNSMSVKQAIIVADTCYSGILTRSVVTIRPSGMSREKRYEWLLKISGERSRTVLSSGGLKPVLDAGTGGHSIFASALLGVLEKNTEILEARALYREVRSKVLDTSRRFGFEQTPQYAANLQAGHKAGDFLFVPVN